MVLQFTRRQRNTDSTASPWVAATHATYVSVAGSQRAAKWRSCAPRTPLPRPRSSSRSMSRNWAMSKAVAGQFHRQRLKQSLPLNLVCSIYLFHLIFNINQKPKLHNRTISNMPISSATRKRPMPFRKVKNATLASSRPRQNAIVERLKRRSVKCARRNWKRKNCKTHLLFIK